VVATCEPWSIAGVSSRGTAAALRGAEPAGRRLADGFERNDVVAAPGGRTFAVSACVLSLGDETLVLDDQTVHRVVQLSIAGDVPPPGAECLPVALRFHQDGIPGFAEPVLNSVTVRGASAAPRLVDRILEICPRAPCGGAAVNVFLSRAAVEAPGHEVSEPDSGLLGRSVDLAADLEVGRPPGAAGTIELAAQLSSRGAGRGIEGWALALALRGDLEILGATLEGTAADLAPEGRVRQGFQSLDVLDPERPHAFSGVPQGPGVVSTVVLAFDAAATLLPTGTATALRLRLRERVPSGRPAGDGVVVFDDGLWQANRMPINNAVLLEGLARPLCARQALRIRFQPGVAFVRCDAAGDARLDIADPVRTLDALFRGGAELACAAAADCNGDRAVDISDAVYALGFLFLGGRAPGAPFPDCGFDPEQPELACAPTDEAGCR
jgi:hypothetical protein